MVSLRTKQLNPAQRNITFFMRDSHTFSFLEKFLDIVKRCLYGGTVLVPE
jgi:hypothetical protein